MAPLRSPEIKTWKYETYRFSRNHQNSYTEGYRTATRHWHQPGECSAGTPYLRPYRGFRAFTCSVEKGKTCTFCRSGTIGCRTSDRRTRTWDTGFQERSFLSCHSCFPRTGCWWQAGRDESRTGTPPEDKEGSPKIPRIMQGSHILYRRYRNPPGKEKPGSPIYHLNPTTGSCPQTRLHCSANHDGCTEALRIGINHLYAYRLGKSVWIRHRGKQSCHRTDDGRPICASTPFRYKD